MNSFSFNQNSGFFTTLGFIILFLSLIEWGIAYFIETQQNGYWLGFTTSTAVIFALVPTVISLVFIFWGLYLAKTRDLRSVNNSSSYEELEIKEKN
ncbi:MAG: hypothetical protein ACFFD4_04940 [Candidatus Odinarchaeota archaeon]